MYGDFLSPKVSFSEAVRIEQTASTGPRCLGSQPAHDSLHSSTSLLMRLGWDTSAKVKHSSEVPPLGQIELFRDMTQYAEDEGEDLPVLRLPDGPICFPASPHML